MINKPYPSIQDLITMIGDAGKHLSDIGASEGTAGNISVCFSWEFEPREVFSQVETIHLPQRVPELKGMSFLVTGSGRRLREILEKPTTNLACLIVDEGGQTAQMYTSPQREFQQVTSEFNSHLGVHYDQVISTNTNFHAIIHIHPPYLTYLSHIPRYQDTQYLSRHALRWQPEMIVNLPEGIGFAPFEIPASTDLVSASVRLLRKHRVVVWAKHGVIARSDVSIKRAADRMEYAETGAWYEYINLTTGELGEGLSDQEIRSICKAFNIQQNIF
jgi:rhamnulose-1-phosphate aldolase